MVRSVIFVVVMASVVLLGGMGAMTAALGEGGERTAIENESFEPVGGETTELEHSNIDNAEYDETVTVVDNQDNEFIEGEDYEWHEENGTITTINGSSLAEESNAYIDYAFGVPTDEAQDMFAMLEGVNNGLVATIFGVFMLVLVLAGRSVGGGL